MSIVNNLKETLTNQIYELEALQSVYPEELSVADHGILADINKFIAEECEEVPHRLEYSISVPFPQGDVQVHVTLPHEYPNARPDIYVRSSVLNRIEQTNLNEALSAFTKDQEVGEPIVYALVSWVQDSAEVYLNNSKLNRQINESKKQDDNRVFEFARYWIYSHHIYSKLKRRDVWEKARENSLTGFCLAGKPGVICVEGDLEDCETFWQEVKAMTWHRILVKLIEKDFPCSESLEKNQKFSSFQEIYFPSSDRHNDMGQLLKYLTEHNLHYAFKEIFGVEARPMQGND